MSRHLSPSLMARLATGGLDARRVVVARGHLAECASCERAYERLRSGLAAAREIRDEDAPELPWEEIGAKVYWRSSQERRASESTAPSRSRPYALAAVPVLAAIGLMWWQPWAASGDAGAARSPSALSVPPQPAPIEAIAAAPVPNEAAALETLVTLRQGDVLVDGDDLDMQSQLQAGQVLQSSEGQVAVQFGERSAMRLGEESRLEVISLSESLIELDIEGVVDLDLTRRPPEQRVVIRAGTHEVLVRGTAFRVDHRDEELDVSCLRGRVAVSNGTEMVVVPAGHSFDFGREQASAEGLRSLPMSEGELAELQREMLIPMLSEWGARDELLDSTAVLAIDAQPGHLLAVDGAIVGRGSLEIRTSLGVHRVAEVDSDFEIGDGRTVELAGGERGELRVAPRPSRKEGRQLRKTQFGDGMAESQGVESCLRPLAKQGLMEGAYLLVEVGVNSDGSKSYLNILDSNLSPSLQRCLRQAADELDLPRGPSASFRYRLSY